MQGLNTSLTITKKNCKFVEGSGNEIPIMKELKRLPYSGFFLVPFCLLNFSYYLPICMTNLQPMKTKSNQLKPNNFQKKLFPQSSYRIFDFSHSFLTSLNSFPI